MITDYELLAGFEHIVTRLFPRTGASKHRVVLPSFHAPQYGVAIASPRSASMSRWRTSRSFSSNAGSRRA